MHANASKGAKVLPIANISIRKTGMFSTTAEARGKSKAGRHPPIRSRNQNSDGAYASENNNAAMINEVAVAPRRSVELNCCPSINENAVRIDNKASNHEPSEMESS